MVLVFVHVKLRDDELERWVESCFIHDNFCNCMLHLVYLLVIL